MYVYNKTIRKFYSETIQKFSHQNHSKFFQRILSKIFTASQLVHNLARLEVGFTSGVCQMHINY
jgi:hypothetical protein